MFRPPMGGACRANRIHRQAKTRRQRATVAIAKMIEYQRSACDRFENA